jgi:hypothetical protein
LTSDGERDGRTAARAERARRRTDGTVSATAGAALRRVPDALDELVALVESARAMPLSSSCVIPREEALDLLDELRAALPAALEDAREVMAAREELLGQARDRRDRITADARATGS